MIYYSDTDPRIFPHIGCTCSQVDRLQDVSISDALNRTKLNEVGRTGILDWKKDTPGISVSMRQFEYGSIDIFQRLSNKNANKIELTDFESSVVDLALYRTDNNGTFLGTNWVPNLRTSSINLSIGDPNAVIERNFSLVGEDDKILQDNNKYLIELRDALAAGASHTIVIGAGAYSTYPTPVIDPDNSGQYILKIVRERSSARYELLTTDYTYDSGTKTITIAGSESGDIYKVFYSAASYISGSTVFTDNDSDLSHIEADSAVIYLTNSANQLYRLQSVSVDISFDRFDIGEIGNEDKVLYGARDTNVSISLGRTLEDYSIEEYLRGASQGIISARDYADDLTLVIKLYNDADKSSFKVGYQFTNLTPTALDDGTTVQEYGSRGITLGGETGFISNTNGDFA